MPPTVDAAYQESVVLLNRASTEWGFVASPIFGHYDAIWTRDAVIASLGALATGDKELIKTVRSTLDTVGGAISPLGQVAAVVRPNTQSWDWGEGGAVDATAWYVILAGAMLEITGEVDLIAPHWGRVKAGLDWLRHQDVTGTGLISGAPATDWMDSSLTRAGRTLNLNVLYYWATEAASRLAAALDDEQMIDPEEIKWRINLLFWPSRSEGPERLFIGSGVKTVPDTFPHQATIDAHQGAAEIHRRHYVSHVVHSHYDEHCDVLANLMAVCLGVAGVELSRKILDYLRDETVFEPYPSRSWVDPITDTDSGMRLMGAESHIEPRWRNEPYTYHNGGAWPFIGGFHVAALAAAGRVDEGSELLGELASANRAGDGEGWGFHEWLHGRSGVPKGAKGLAWNAGTYVLAWHSIHNPELVQRLF